MANPGRWFKYLFIVTVHNLIEVLRWYFNDHEPACGEVDYCPLGQTNIISNDSAARLMLSYRLFIWPIRSTCTKTHGFSSAIILGGRCTQIVFLFLNYWHILHSLTYSLLSWQGLSNNILHELFSQVYYYLCG